MPKQQEFPDSQQVGIILIELIRNTQTCACTGPQRSSLTPDTRSPPRAQPRFPHWQSRLRSSVTSHQYKTGLDFNGVPRKQVCIASQHTGRDRGATQVGKHAKVNICCHDAVVGHLFFADTFFPFHDDFRTFYQIISTVCLAAYPPCTATVTCPLVCSA